MCKENRFHISYTGSWENLEVFRGTWQYTLFIISEGHKNINYTRHIKVTSLHGGLHCNLLI